MHVSLINIAYIYTYLATACAFLRYSGTACARAIAFSKQIQVTQTGAPQDKALEVHERFVMPRQFTR